MCYNAIFTKHLSNTKRTSDVQPCKLRGLSHSGLWTLKRNECCRRGHYVRVLYFKPPPPLEIGLEYPNLGCQLISYHIHVMGVINKKNPNISSFLFIKAYSIKSIKWCLNLLSLFTCTSTFGLQFLSLQKQNAPHHFQ